MGKFQKQKSNRPSHTPYNKPSKTSDHGVQNKSIPKIARPQQQNQIPAVPFDNPNRILLVGEGDFSFAHSLYTSHHCQNVIATCFDSAKILAEKYPQSTGYIQELEDAACEDETINIKILYGVDATKLGKGGLGSGGKEVKKGEFDRIVFNFPHVGGLTKDVNRQVRYNQELLVSFFKAAVPLLAPEGSIVVTIFEGEPYSLWNIRDLARHVGLKVGRSFKFQAEAYPGYKHARTLGNIEGGGGWKGEDREARTYIFERKDGEGKQEQPKPQKNKRSGSSDSDEDD
ncbi:MAG: hypothetical protein L6R42_004221 [Xanthoria sp. 1 TBL-2021]|nr:MAG: hypothetical protein L6R42_004221 [Xanthoria sp. 1 TBL-2021]